MIALKDLCLSSIIKNLELYAAHSAAEDRRLKTPMEFLCRVYSLPIIKELEAKNRMKPEYASFLINKSLRELDSRWLDSCPWDFVEKKMAEIGPNLTKVSLREQSQKYKNSVETPSCKQEDRHLNFLCSVADFCPNIEIIHIKGSFRVSVRDIKYMCCNIRSANPYNLLKEVLLESNYVNDNVVKYMIKNIPSLEKIDYERLPKVLYSMHKNDIDALDKVKHYNLTSLKLEYVQDTLKIKMDRLVAYDDILKICATLCPRLKSLVCTVTKKEHLEWCSKLFDLEEIDFNCGNKTPVSLNEYLQFNRPKLKCLHLRQFSLSLSILAENCPSLESLFMEEVTFLPDEVENIPCLWNLECLSFFYFSLGEQTSKALCHLLSSTPNLKVLTFCTGELFSLEIQTQIFKCCEQCKLRKVNFRCCTVEPVLLQGVLLKCPMLETLDLNEAMLESDDLFVKHYGMDSVARQLRGIARILPNKPKIARDRIDGSDDSDEEIVLDPLKPIVPILPPLFWINEPILGPVDFTNYIAMRTFLGFE